MLLRQLWVSFSLVACLIWIPVVALWRGEVLASGLDGRAVAFAVAAIAIALQLLVGMLVATPLSATPESVRGWAQRSFFARVAAAEAGAILGFIGFVLAANPAVYLAGFVIAVVGMLDAAPTAAKLSRMEKTVRAAGSDVEVLAALTGAGVSR